MRRHKFNESKEIGTIILQMVCAILFCAFSYSYVYGYQSDVFADAQNTLSKGVTHYHKLTGAIIITFCLLLLQQTISRFTVTCGRLYGMTFVPSFLCLGFLSFYAAHPSASVIWLLVGIVISVIVIIFIRTGQGLTIAQKKSANLIVGPVIIGNVFILLLGMIVCAFIGDHSESLHNRLKAARLYKEKKYVESLSVGNQNSSDSILSLIHVKSLILTKGLGEHLFEYVPRKEYWPRHLRMKSHDYILCTYLIDKDLFSFVNYLERHNLIDTNLSKHYREALILFVRSHTNTSITYSDNVMDADFQDFMKLRHQLEASLDYKYRLHDVYGNTYWYYFFFTSSTAFTQSVSKEN